MMFPSRETAERLRKEYPIGCRIVLDEMDDPYTKIPIGSQATCQGVDDAGNILCAWDCGSSLSIAWPVDRCHRRKQRPRWIGTVSISLRKMPAVPDAAVGWTAQLPVMP